MSDRGSMSDFESLSDDDGYTCVVNLTIEEAE